MALAQLSLKLPPEVLADWRRRAAAAGHGQSVRDWLLAELSPPAAEPLAPPWGGLLFYSYKFRCLLGPRRHVGSAEIGD